LSYGVRSIRKGVFGLRGGTINVGQKSYPIRVFIGTPLSDWIGTVAAVDVTAA